MPFDSAPHPINTVVVGRNNEWADLNGSRTRLYFLGCCHQRGMTLGEVTGCGLACQLGVEPFVKRSS